MRAFPQPSMAPPAKAALKPAPGKPVGTRRNLIDGCLRAQRTIGNRAVRQLFEAAFGRRNDAADSLEHEADVIGAAIGAELGPDAMTPGSLSASARRVAESFLGPLPGVAVSDGASGELPAGALASAAGTRIHLAEGALPSALPVYRAVLGHELVHVAQQRNGAGGRRQYLKVGQVEFPDVTVEKQADASVLLVDRIPVLHCAGRMDVQVEYNSGPMQYLIVVSAGAPVTRLMTLDTIGQRYPALEGRLVIGEPQTSLPDEGLAARAAAGDRQQRTVLHFGRKPRASAAPRLAAAPSSPSPQPPVSSAATAAPQSGQNTSVGIADASPYRQMTVAARAAKVGELLEKWLSSQEIEAIFRASASEAEFLQLERAVDFQAVLEKLSEWEVIRLAAAGPILPQYADFVNRRRAEYLARIAREWGLPRAEVFAMFIFDTTTNDEVAAVLSLLAGEQELGRTVGRMLALQLRLAQRGINLAQFKDRDWQASDILTGLGHAASSVMNTAPAVADAGGLAMMRQAGDMPEPYRQAVDQINMAAFMQALTWGNMVLGAADLAFLGLPSTVKGIVYDLPLSVAAGIDEIRQGHVAAGVELLTVPAVVVLSSALGLRAYRKSRMSALLELSGEGKALYDTLKTRIGAPGMQQVAGYIQRDAAARILVAEAGAEGILALHQSQGNVAAARALLQRPRPLPALAPAAEAAELGQGAIDLVYNPATNSWEMPARGKALRAPALAPPAPSAAVRPGLPAASAQPPVKPATPALAPVKAPPQLGPGGPVPATVSNAQQRIAQAQQVLLRTQQQLDAARTRGAKRAELKTAEKGVKQAQTELAEAQRAHARLVQLESDLAALDAQLKHELNPTGGFTAAERLEGRRPQVYPPTGTESGKRFWNLKNREKRARDEVASEVGQSTRILRDQIEAATPGKTARPAALGNAVKLGLTKDGVPLDVTSGRPLTVKNWATDHIVSRDELALDQRFLRLTPRQRDILLLEIPENYLPMSAEANGSKGALSVEQWIAARRASNQALPQAMADALRIADQRARSAIEAKYRELLSE